MGSLKHLFSFQDEIMTHNRLKEILTSPESASSIVREAAPFIYTVPVYSPKFCRDMVKLAGYLDTEQSTDLTVECPRTYQVLFKHAEEYLLPLVNLLYPGVSLHKMENPLLLRHSVASKPVVPAAVVQPGVTVQVRVNLNEGCTGGGLEFPLANYSSQKLPMGYGVIFPGGVTHPFRELPVAEGTWYDLQLILNSIYPGS